MKINSYLSNSENKIFFKFLSALGLTKGVRKAETTSLEMYAKVQEFFKNNSEVVLLFIFEDIDHYVETTKQLMLYTIFNLLTECQVPVVFLCSSMRYDVIDSFEKRIKSRCSLLSVLLYNQSIDTFI